MSLYFPYPLPPPPSPPTYSTPFTPTYSTPIYSTTLHLLHHHPPDEGLGSSGKRYGSGSLGSGSLYLSDSQDWALSPGCSPDDDGGEEAPGPHRAAVSPSLADETFRYMRCGTDRIAKVRVGSRFHRQKWA
ncbi:unnamed protein product [Boreogadus saida]